MQTVYEDQFVRFDVDEQKQVCVGIWKPMYKDDDEWKAVKMQLIKIIKQYGIKRVLAHLKQSVYPTPPSLQKWFVQKLKEYNLGEFVVGVGMIMPEDLIIELSLQQIGENILREVNVPVFYFKDEQMAYSWLGVN